MTETLVPDPNKADGRSGLASAEAPTVILTGPIEFTYVDPTIIGDIEANGDAGLISVSLPKVVSIVSQISLSLCPVLTSIDVSGLDNCGGISIQNNTVLAVISFPALTRTSGGNVLIMANPALHTLNFPALAQGSYTDIETCPLLASINFPVLTSMVNNGSIRAISCDALTEFKAPMLVSAITGAGGENIIIGPNLLLTLVDFSALTSGDNIIITDNPALPTLAFPALTTVNTIDFSRNNSLMSVRLANLQTFTSLTISDCPVLTTFSLPALTASSSVITLSGNAFSASTVNAMLAKLVSLSFNGTVDMSGGTNAAPSGQGIADKATLIGHGASVTTN